MLNVHMVCSTCGSASVGHGDGGRIILKQQHGSVLWDTNVIQYGSDVEGKFPGSDGGNKINFS